MCWGKATKVGKTEPKDVQYYNMSSCHHKNEAYQIMVTILSQVLMLMENPTFCGFLTLEPILICILCMTCEELLKFLVSGLHAHSSQVPH